MKKQPKKHYSVRKKNETVNDYSQYYERVMPKSPEEYIVIGESKKTLFEKIKNFIKEKLL